MNYVYHVATFSAEASGRLVGNHNMSEHRYEDDARQQMNADMEELRARGYVDDPISDYDGDAADELARFRGPNGDNLIVALWWGPKSP